MSNQFVGEIRMFAGNFAIQNWAFCNGQLLPIQQYPAVFSLLGTYYGGNGTTNFALPDFRGRLPMHQGQGIGLASRVIGETGGNDTVTIDSTTMPAHNHLLYATSAAATTGTIGTGVLPGTPTVPNAELYATASAPAGGTLYAAAIPPGGGSNQSHPNQMPSLAVSFIICLSGIFPSRN